jgi:hypothetical protein
MKTITTIVRSFIFDPSLGSVGVKVSLRTGVHARSMNVCLRYSVLCYRWKSCDRLILKDSLLQNQF